LLKQERPPLDREAFRALYDQVTAEINTTRNNDLLVTAFYSKTGDAMFDAGCDALSDWRTRTRRMLTVSAPAGGGKTSFAYAFIVAMTRYAEQHPKAPYGAVFVVDRIERADQVYHDLDALLPGNKVAIWTKEHEDLFSREALRQYPVIVVTNQFYLNSNGHHARNVNNRGHFQERALTIVDERPEEVTPFEVVLSEAEKVREVLPETHPETKAYLDDLLRFMERFSYEPTNKLFIPGRDIAKKDFSKQLAWFTGPEAARLAISSGQVPGLKQLFGFAKALGQGCGFVDSVSKPVRYVGWTSNLTINLSAGTILLDATADIDGVSHIVTWREHAEVPHARYDNLEITHVPQHTTKRLSEYFRKIPNRRAYANWMEQTIKEHMQPGEKGLVVCKLALFENQNVPKWPEGNEHFKRPKLYTEEYGWEIEGRKLCATHWGTGIGSNAWKDADVVFLFDEFHIPNRIAAATVQGLREQSANEGDLGAMRAIG
jgi:hypothetical protein